MEDVISQLKNKNSDKSVSHSITFEENIESVSHSMTFEKSIENALKTNISDADFLQKTVGAVGKTLRNYGSYTTIIVLQDMILENLKRNPQDDSLKIYLAGMGNLIVEIDKLPDTVENNLAKDRAVKAFQNVILQMLKNNPENGFLPELFSWIGLGITSAAMAGQGLLGGLLGYMLANEKLGITNQAGLAAISGTSAITAFMGKVAIVHYYNDLSFRNLANLFTKEYWTEGKWTYSPADFINSLWSIFPATLFANLSAAGMNLSEKLLRTGFNIDIKQLQYWGVQSPFMVCAFVCNILGFPFIHAAGLSLFINAAEHFGQNYDYRQAVNALSDDMEAKRNQIKALYESGEIDEAKKMLAPLAEALLTQNIVMLRKLLLKMSDLAAEHKKSESDGILYAKHGLGSFAAGLTVWGFSNFYDLGAVELDFLTPRDIPVLGGINAISLSMMAEGPYRLATAFIDHCRGYHVPLNILRKWETPLIHFFTFLACITGVTPNVYQSSSMIKQPIETVFASAYASFIVEYGGFASLFKGFMEKRRKANDPDALFFKHVDDMLLKATDLSNLPQGDIHALMGCQEEIPQYKDKNKGISNIGDMSRPRNAGDDAININFQDEDNEKVSLVSSSHSYPTKYKPTYQSMLDVKTGIINYAGSLNQSFWKKISCGSTEVKEHRYEVNNDEHNSLQRSK